MFQLVTLDDEFLADIGLSDITDAEKQQVLEDVRTTLEAKVGVKLIQGLSDEQVNQFNDITTGDEPQPAIDWMETNIPNYQDVVMQELDTIVEQIKNNTMSFIKQL